MAVKASHYAQAHSLLESLASYEETRSDKKKLVSQQRLLIHLARLYVSVFFSCLCRDAPTRNEHHRKMNPLPSLLHLRTLNQNTATCVELTKYAPSSSQHLTCTHIQYMHALLPSIALEANVKESVQYREPPLEACCAAKAGGPPRSPAD